MSVITENNKKAVFLVMVKNLQERQPKKRKLCLIGFFYERYELCFAD